jgi:hypothetical protein
MPFFSCKNHKVADLAIVSLQTFTVGLSRRVYAGSMSMSNQNNESLVELNSQVQD